LEGLARGLPEPARLIAEKEQRLDQWVERILNSRDTLIRRRRERLNVAWSRMKTPRERVIEASGRIDLLAGRLRAAAMALIARTERAVERIADRLVPELALRKIERAESRLHQFAGLLESFSYERVLERGFVLVYDAKDGPVTSAAAAAPGMSLRLRFRDGERHAVATDGARPRRAKAKASGGEIPQGSLL